MKRFLSGWLCLSLFISLITVFPPMVKANELQVTSGSDVFEPVETATVESVDGIPTLHVNGEPRPLIGWFQWGWYPRSTESAANAGIHIYQPRHSTGYPTLEVWLPEMERIVQEDPDAYFLPILWIGSDTPYGFSRANSKEVNVDTGASWGANSYGSDEWKNRAELFLREQIRRYEASPVGDRILGYTLSAGSTGEWFNVDTWSNRDFDRSLGNLSNFRHWLKAAYSSDISKLREAWGDEKATFETVEIPAKVTGTPFLNPSEHRAAVDYVEYQNGQISRFATALSSVVKDEVNGNKLVAIYSGYTLAFGQYGPLSGELDINTLLNSPDIDLIYSPMDYTNRDLEQGFSSVHGAMDSAKLHGKLYVAEDDYATHMGTDTHGAPPLTNSVEGSLALLWRNFGLSLTKSYGQHWYDDAGYGGFNNARMMNEIHKMNQLAEASIQLPRQSGAEIALVVDEFSQMIQSSSGSHVNERLRLVRNELSQTGAPYDIILLSDVLEGRADDYKLYIFANAYALDDNQRTQLTQWDPTNKTLVWLYAAGYWKRDQNGTDSRQASHMEEVTGLSLTEAGSQAFTIGAVDAASEPLLHGIAPGTSLGGSASAIPLFVADESEGVTVLGRSGLYVTAAYKEHSGGSNVWLGSPSISSVQFYRNLAEQADVHVYSHSGKQVNANESFTVVTFPNAVTDRIYFRDAQPKYDITNNRVVVPNADGSLEVSSTGPQTFVFYNGNADDLQLGGGNKDTILDHLVIRLSGETLQHQKLESDENRQLELITGGHITLDVTGITPEGFYFYKDEMDSIPQWSSSDESVAVIDGNGQLSTLAPGQTVITATVGAISATMEITVKQPYVQSLLTLLDTATWSTWSNRNGWHPFELGTGNEYGTANLMAEVESEDGETYHGVYRYEPLQSSEQVGSAVGSVLVPNKAGVKVIATLKYPAGTPEGTYNSVILESYRAGTANNLFVVQKDLAVNGNGTSIEADLSPYVGQYIRLDVNVRHKSATDVESAKVDLVEFKFVYDDEEAEKRTNGLTFASANTFVKLGATEKLSVLQTYSDGSREDWTTGAGAYFYTDRPDLVAIDEQGQIEALGYGTATITLATNEAVARAYVHVIDDDYDYQDLLSTYAEEGEWSIEPTYESFEFGTPTAYGSAIQPESVIMEDGHSYNRPIIFSGSADGTGINGRLNLKIPDASQVHLIGKVGFTKDEVNEQKNAVFYMRTWHKTSNGQSPFYNSYSIDYDGELTTFEIDVSAFRGQTLPTTDIYVQKADGSVLEVGLVELQFRVSNPVAIKPAAIVADQAYSVLKIDEESTLSVRELTDSGFYRSPSLPVTWSTEQSEVISVNASGGIRGMKPGVAIVTADMGPHRSQMIVEVRPQGMNTGQAADPYRWTSLKRLPQFSIKEADIPYFYVGLHLREPVMSAPVVTTPVEPVSTQASTYNISGNAAPGARVQLWNDRNGNGWLDDSDTLVAEGKRSESETQFRIPVSFATAGKYQFLVTGANDLGERSSETVVPVIQFKPSPPYNGGTVIVPETSVSSEETGSETGSYASEELRNVDNKPTLQVRLHANQILRQFAQKEHSIVNVRLANENRTIIEGLTASDLKQMDESSGLLNIQTTDYIVPIKAGSFDLEKIAALLNGAAMSDVKMQIKLEQWTPENMDKVKKSLSNKGYVWRANTFTVKVSFSFNDQSIDAIFKSGNHLDILLGLTDDERMAATGVAVYPSGDVYPIPTSIEEVDGKVYALLHNFAPHDGYGVISYAKQFNDMNGHWGKGEVEELASRLVVLGVSDTNFEPKREIKRKEYTALMIRGLGLMQSGVKASSFNDVEAGSWESMPIELAYEAGIVSGFHNGSFKGDQGLTREQGIVMAANAIRFVLGDQQTEWTQQEEDVLLSTFKDEDQIADWARGAFVLLIKEGILKGNGDGELLPDKLMNRAEASALVLRIIKHFA
ncbi:S-layer homology domain-containing protein [Paenibacillus sp. SYP-B4298]|uniref:S-layer homology domain-containing protein n=1 Tax=Paenibacillus sp. SYP-B4298 TaxID=2996034 RepID=UPI0022DE7CF3|nr:S-layer homology domain-containing protein [Paenibacillus sp. SYP-B4298]